MATKKNITDLFAQVLADFPDNTTQEISASDERSALDNIIESFLNLKTPGFEVEVEGGYETEVTLTDRKAFAYKGWVDDIITGLSGDFFANGGNSFGATATIGTNDDNDFLFETNGTTRGGIANSGEFMFGTSTPFVDAYMSILSTGNTSATEAVRVRNSDMDDMFWITDNGSVSVKSTMNNATPVFSLYDNADVELFTVLANASIIAPGSFLDVAAVASFNPYARSAFGALGNVVIDYSVNSLLRTDVAGITGDRLNWRLGYLLDGGTVNLDWLLKQQVGNWNVTGDYGVGVATASARLHVVKTTEQFRAGYDSTNYFSTTVGSTGSVTFDLTGTSPVFTFSKAAIFNGTITSNANIGNANFASITTGASAQTQTELLFGGATTIRARVTSRGSTTASGAANESYSSWVIGSQSFTEAGSGTHAVVASLVVKAVAITAGAATTTNSSTVYIEGAATGATNNYALWVDSGTSRFDGSFNLADAVDFNLGTTTGTKMGTSVSQKWGVWNATPIVQPSSANQAAVTTTVDTTAATNIAPYGYTTQAQADDLIAEVGQLKTLVNQLRTDIIAIGLIKGSA